MTRRYDIPNLLARMAELPCWPISVSYPGDGTAVVSCGRWGRGDGWIAYTEVFPESEMPERIVSSRYPLVKDTTQPAGDVGRPDA